MSIGTTAKKQAGRLMRRASISPTYRRIGATMVRHNSTALMTFTLKSIMSPTQYGEEFIPFLDFVRARRPTAVLEIGTARGGTFFMLCQVAHPRARLVTVDITEPSSLVESYRHGHQEVSGIVGDSTSAAVNERVRRQFPNGVDVLFIDGDHRYEGVRADCEIYSPLVRPGGIMAFHDIVPDAEERTGAHGWAWAGGVPQFWREFKAVNDGSWHVREFVRSWDQEGFGIGVGIKPHE
jgi:predicted O-methyltransferase YrrM